MPQILAYLFPFLSAAIGSLAMRVLTAVGIGVVTFVGLDAVISGYQSAALAALGGGGEGVGFVVNASGFAESVQIVTSAIVARLGIAGIRKLMYMGASV